MNSGLGALFVVNVIRVMARGCVMFLSTLPIGEIRELHLQRLIDDAVAESRELEFKRDRVGDDRDAKREFLKDVTAVANTFGGHLIIGIDERDGIADRLAGITGYKSDSEKLRLLQLLPDSVEPSLVGVQIQEVPIDAGGFALVFRIPRSWNPPHRVNMGCKAFFLRNSAGVSEMDVHQLRAVFLGAAETEQRARSFRNERLQEIRIPNSSPRTTTSDVALLHIFPIGGSMGVFDLREVEKRLTDLVVFSPSARGFNFRPNLDGFFVNTGVGQSGRYPAYSQLYRDGRLECATGNIIGNIEGSGLSLFWRDIEIAIVVRLKRCLMARAELGFSLPSILLLSLLGVEGSILAASPASFRSDPADRNDLLFEPVVIDTDDLARWPAKVRPLLDALHQSYGRRMSPSFNDKGEWS